jgi:N-acetylglucosamine-6-phosphate deacetylase
MEDILLFRNGRILTSQGWIRNGSLLVRGSKILEISKVEETPDNCTTIIDAHGGEIVPGAIELHAHGGNGHNFEEATETAFMEAINTHLYHGTTSIYPTIASTSLDTTKKALRLTEELMSQPDSPILGLHLEGPYLNPKMTGEQQSKYIVPFHPEIYKELIRSYKCLKRWDAAPEIEGAEDFGAYCVRHGVLPAIAHTQALYQDVYNAYEAGFSHITHFYNGMTYFHKTQGYKHEGAVESILAIPGFTTEVIFDGIHLPYAVLRMIYILKGVEKIALITNAHGGVGVKTIQENTTHETSDTTTVMDNLIQVAVKKVGIQFEDAVRMSSETPARIMGELNHVGILRNGYDANICIYDTEANLKFVMQKGKIFRNDLEKSPYALRE